MTTTVTTVPPMILDEVEAVRVERLSPSFVRVELGGACLAEFGVDGPLYDQRIKLVFPYADGPLPSLAGADESWLRVWLERPVEERGHMRTYTIRDVVGSAADTRLVVDFVVHGEDGSAGPGSSWAERARPGDRLVLLAPRRGHAFGGIEFDPGTAARLLLVGDETAVPAICSILAQLPWRARGAAFLEVPTTTDVPSVVHPEGVEVVWLPRDGAPLGSLVHDAVLEHLGVPGLVVEEPDVVDPDLWETPTYSSSGEEVESAVTVVGHDLDDLYAWIAGESGMVIALRRALVSDLGVDRRQVAFMGYWRRGVAMRS
ncbi:siderophore-interacting protein [Nocardioides sp. T2.26MG-1]|uniref:siderophore-interacting protein n=1 Tax=Nocardioides sp. T2.26MG-1 TaxID=3041166 RepID=UPI00247739F4|nr:siderophore-interacting protein [Nocardioides sp. T2.26MG-1]CAI9412003.1 Vibriobactin utilization protein ViuB [Nocardioides sp. T2.26MG-1]